MSLWHHNDVINTNNVRQNIIFIHMMPCHLTGKILKLFLQYEAFYCNMFAIGCCSVKEEDRELPRAIVVVQLELQMRTGQIRIQRTFLF